MRAVQILSFAFLLAAGSQADTSTASPTCSCDSGKTEQEKKNTEITLALYREVYKEKNVDAIDKYVAEEYIEHAPPNPDGREALKSASKQWFDHGPFDFEILRTAAEGDLVFVHLKLVSSFFNEAFNTNSSVAVVDIMRFENGKIREHWDSVTALPTKSVSKHPLF